MSATHVIERWNPEDSGFWRTRGERIARRNLWLSVPALVLAFAVWMVWSAVVVELPAAGFRYSANQLFWLAALPALSGATLRIFYAFAVPAFGGRRFNTIATASLLLPALGIGFAVQRPDTPYEWMVALALLCGLGGGNFASSMAHVGFFYPQSRKGTALGLSAGLGNLGVALAQGVVPLVISVGVFGALGGAPQTGASGQPVWLQNAGFVWVPFIAASALACWFGMDDLADLRGGFAEQALIVRRRHTWLLSLLYLGTFGSVIGFAAGAPLLAATAFPAEAVLQVAWLGPLVAALVRPLGGWLADRFGGARVTLWTFVALIVGVAALQLSLPRAGSPGHWAGATGAFAVLFVAAGVGTGSSFRMIPGVYVGERQRSAGPLPAARARAARDGDREAAAAYGFAGAVGAYGGFFVPKAWGTSIALAGGPEAALAAFAAFYLVCLAVTWWWFARRHAPLPC
jgi:NNP family nitrate/nitrite transporter-like MFS transporter